VLEGGEMGTGSILQVAGTPEINSGRVSMVFDRHVEFKLYIRESVIVGRVVGEDGGANGEK
jgi:hypothetical protein